MRERREEEWGVRGWVRGERDRVREARGEGEEAEGEDGKGEMWKGRQKNLGPEIAYH